MSKKKSTLATAAVIAGIATVGVTAGERNVHADTVAANAQTQDATAQYQAAQKQADQANAADAAKTDAAIANQQKQEDAATAALRQANDQKYDAKSQAVSSDVAAQNSAATKNYQVSSAALVQSESADVKNQQAANDKAYSDMAAKAITEDQYNAKMSDAKASYDKNVNQINTDAQKATNEAGTVRDNAKKAANDKAEAATRNAEKAKQDKINAQKEANKQAIDNAQNGLDYAVDHAPIIEKRDATPANGRVDGLTDFAKEQAKQQRATDNQANGIEGTSAPFATNIALGDFSTVNGFFDDSVKDNYVSNENELPMTFKPGLIQYDGSHDTSEKINGQLTEDQMKRLNELSVHWMNELRHEWYNNGYLSPDGESMKELFPHGFIDLVTNENVWNVAKQLGQDRTNAKYPYMHTGTDTSKPSVKSHSEYTRQYAKDELDPAIIKASKDTGIDYQKLGDIYSYSGAEDMFQIEGSTMLQLEVSLYNRLQSMLWGEATQTADGQIMEEGGHLGIALSPSKQLVGMAFQPIGDNTWITTWDFGGLSMSYDDLENSDKRAMLFATAKNIQQSSPLVTTGVIDQIKAAQKIRKVRDLNAPIVLNAEKNLNDTKDNAAKKLQEVMNEVLPASIKETLNNEIKAADDNYAAQVQSINNDRDAKLADAKKGYDAEVDAINAIPNPKTLAQLKKDNAAKIAKIEADYATKQADLKKGYEAKLVAIAKAAEEELAAYKQSLNDAVKNSPEAAKYEAKIAELKKAHEDFVAANNDKLAKLHDQLFPKTTNTVVLGKGVNAKSVALATSGTGSNGKATGSVMYPSATKARAISATGADEGRANAANGLPQTGNKNSAAVVALGAVAAMFGFGLVAKKREY